MLILADLSGIQDYLFEVREVGGKQARTLRFRSLYIQLVAEAVGARLLHAAGLEEDRLVFCAAGKLAIDGAGLTDPPNAALDTPVAAADRERSGQIGDRPCGAGGRHGCLRMPAAPAHLPGA